ncbi:MAG: glycosyl hydrolase [bacterium]
MTRKIYINILLAALMGIVWMTPALCAPPAYESFDLKTNFANPPDSARPGVYWYFMDGNLSRDGMTRDLESMKAAGLGSALFLEVNVGVPRGPVGFLSDEWQSLFAHAVHEAERLGLEITLGSGPGWAGSGGPWVKPGQSMQHLVASETHVAGPSHFTGKLPLAPPRQPFFNNMPFDFISRWRSFFKNVVVLAFPTPTLAAKIPDIDEKALYYRAPFTSQPGVKPYLATQAEYPATPAGGAIPLDQIIDLTDHIKPDGSLDWQVPSGNWTILRFVSRNNGAITRPAPEPGLGFECDKFDAAALDAHFNNYAAKLLDKVGPPKAGAGLTMLHIDSWEMGAQNWTPKLREEFIKRRGYDPQPYYPAYLGFVVGSRELTERFLWDLRRTGSELIVENHAERLKELGRQRGLTLSIEPYDMNPAGDFDLGAVADMPMCEFWSLGFNSSFSCAEATSIAHVLGRPVVAAEAFTSGGDHWRNHPGNLKNQGDWAFAAGVNRFMYHTFAHKPNEGRPGMAMGPYGVHWDRGQTWWPIAGAYHKYIARSQYLLRQGRTVADILYLIPEGAPNVFQPPVSAFEGSDTLPDRRGYNFDGCSPVELIKSAGVRDGRIVFPGGAEYRLLVLPDSPTMTPELLNKIKELVMAGATVVGPAPQKSPSLVNYPACDSIVAAESESLWGALMPPATLTELKRGKGRIIWGGGLYDKDFKAAKTAAETGVEPSGLKMESGLYPQYGRTAEIIREMGVNEDFLSSGPVRYTHRREGDLEIYFVSNRSGDQVETTGAFRVDGLTPELWEALTGTIRALPEFAAAGGVTTIPLRFDPYESYFVVFRKSDRQAESEKNFPTFKTSLEIGGPWDVSFDPAWGGPEKMTFDKLYDWSKRPEDGIRYYSGAATYRTSFDGNIGQFVSLGNVANIASLKLNGAELGVVWSSPWRVAIPAGLLRVRDNRLEIVVANLWANRLIGDAALPDEQRLTWTTNRPYKKNSPLLESGLLGPVRLLSWE